MSNNKVKNDEILINNIYNSNPKAYANEGKNIVHEIINLFKADNGKHYIYIVSDGTIAQNHNDRISDILLTRSVGNKMAEIIAWVKSPKQLIKKENKFGRKKLSEIQKEYIDDIKYDGVCVEKIFEKNTYRGEKEENIIYATFVAEEGNVVKPKESIFLTYDKENENNYPNTYFISKKMVNQNQKTYIDKTNYETDYKILRGILDNKEIWEKNDTFNKVNIDNYTQNNTFNFLKMIKHEYYEPAFSNMLQYYFLKNKKIFKKFAKDVLNIKNIDINSEAFEVKREEYNIDLLIRDTNHIIVIENKIKSGINGIKYDDYGDIVQTQLEKYANYAKCNPLDKSKEKNNKDHPHYYDKYREPHFFIFAPNYKHLKSNKFVKAAKYTVINYRQIYNFFYNNKKFFIDDKYFEDFLSAINKHATEVDSEIYDIMYERLVNRINEIKNKE